MTHILWGASRIVTAVALTVATPVWAADDQADAASSATPAEPTEAGIGDIIVTASRRSESVQNSSLAISVVGSEQLSRAGVTNSIELQNVVPGLTVASSGAITTTFIRGVGSFSTDANADPAVATNINGVYISRPGGIGPIFYDLERVEVLKGPQGTLYGRNATGGALNLITTRPRKEFGGDVAFDTGNYGLVRATGALNIPLGDTFAIRTAGQITSRGGYLSDGYDDADSQAARVTALWTPSSVFDILITGEYTHVGGTGAGPVKRSLLTATPADPWQGPSVGTISQPPTAFVPLGPSTFGSRIKNDGQLDVTVWAISAEMHANLGFATLTFLPAYRDTTPNARTYQPGFLFDTKETSKQQSYELRLSNESKALKWVVGGYYFDEDQTQFYDLQAIPYQSSTVASTLGTKSYAVFGEATVSVMSNLRLIGGLRYSNDEKKQDGLSSARNPAFIVTSTTNNFGRATFDNVSWKVGAELDVGPRNMLFATVSTGYKAGGFFPSVVYPDNIFQPEKLTAYTVGSRNRFLGDTLQVNVEGFYWDYSNKQERFLGATPAGGTGLLTTNAGKATLWGANVDLVFKPSRNDVLRFNAEYLHTKYDAFQYTVYSPAGAYPVQATGCTLGAATPFAATPNPVDVTQSINCSGQRLVRAPEFSGSASYEHIFELHNNWEVIPSATAQFATEQWLTADFIGSGEDKGYIAVDASLTIQNPIFSLQFWGRNLTNKAIYTGGFRYPFSLSTAAGGDPTLYYATIRPPRTYGVTVRAKF